MAGPSPDKVPKAGVATKAPLEGTQHRPHFPREQREFSLPMDSVLPQPSSMGSRGGRRKENGREEVSVASGGGWGLASVISAAQPLGQPAMEGWTMGQMDGMEEEDGQWMEGTGVGGWRE